MPSKVTSEWGKGQAVWPANNGEANKNKIKLGLFFFKKQTFTQ